MKRWGVAWALLCALGLWCLSGCASGGEAEEQGCQRNSDCNTGQVCAQGACVAQSCRSDFDCAVGQVCVSQRCEAIGENNGDPNNGDPNNGDPNNGDPNNGDPDLGLDLAGDAEEDLGGADAEDLGAPDMSGDIGGEDLGGDQGADQGQPDMEAPGCAQDSDCDATEHCVASRCEAGCHRDEGCLLGQVCDVQANVCVVPGCEGDGDCGPGQRCDVESGQCLGPFVVCAGVECAAQEWCDHFQGRCLGALPGEPCAVAADCAEGAACAPVIDAQGEVALVCRPAQGALGPSAPCAMSAECASGLCFQGACYAPCEAQEECGDAAACLPGEVRPYDNETPMDAQDDPSYALRGCVPVEVCATDADCDEGEVCRLRFVRDAVLSVCDEAVGPQPAGGPCDEDADCATGACLGLPGGVRLCLGPCEGDDSCGPENVSCEMLRFVLDDGGTPADPQDDEAVERGACVWSPSAEVLCQSDADCGAGEVCAVDTRSPEGEVRNACRAAWGEVGPGGLCEGSNDCASGLCLLGGHCYGPCTMDEVCLEGTTCEEVPQEQGSPLTFCVEPPRPCQSSLGCRDGELCLPVISATQANTLEAFCVLAPNPEGAGAGAPCTQNAQCASEICFGASGGDGRCYEVCDAATNRGCEAGRCYADQFLYRFTQETPSMADDVFDSTSACVTDIGSYARCDENTDCPGFEICYPTLSRRADAWEPRCVLPLNVGGNERGGACFSDAQCATDLCLDFSAFTSMCLTLCADDFDCEGLFTTCQARTFVVDDRGTLGEGDDIVDTLNICVPF